MMTADDDPGEHRLRACILMLLAFALGAAMAAQHFNP